MSLWSRQENETDSAFSAFTIYRDLPQKHADTDKHRSLRNVAGILGHSQTKTVEVWSSKYNWQERVAAYDNHMDTLKLSVLEVGLKDLQSAVIEQTGMRLVGLGKILDERIKDLMRNPDDYTTLDVQRLVESVKKTDDLMRRAAHLPTTFTAINVDNEEQEYYIVGSNE